MLRTAVASSVSRSGGLSATTLDIQACFLVSRLLMTVHCVADWCICRLRDACVVNGDASCSAVCRLLTYKFWSLVTDRCLQLLTLLRDSVRSVVDMLSLKAVFNKTGLVFEKKK